MLYVPSVLVRDAAQLDATAQMIPPLVVDAEEPFLLPKPRTAKPPERRNSKPSAIFIIA